MKGYLVGYYDEKDGYKVYIPDKDDVVLSRDIVFKDEEKCSSDEVSNSYVTEVTLSDTDTQGIVDAGNEGVNAQNQTRLRNRNNVRQPVWQDDFVMLADGVEPTCYTEAIGCGNTRDWQEAMNSEIVSLAENNTWTLIDRRENMHIVNKK